MPITLDVITKVVESSLRDSSATAEKHFQRAGEEAGTGFSKSFSKSISNSADMQKAFDKAADAAGKLRVEQQKLNELQEKGAGGARLIAQQERVAKSFRDTERAVRDTADTFQRADRSASNMMSTLANITAGTRIGGLTSQASSLASSLSGVGLATGVVVGGFTAIAVGAVAAANKMYDMGRAWDDIADNITAKTGKVGSELESITDQVAKVSTTTAATQEELGKIAGSAVQSLRLSGDQLGSMIKQIAELNKLTGDETNMRGLGMVFRMFKVDAKDQTAFLDQLYTAFTKTGISVNDLIGTLEKGGTVLSGFGMSATQAASVIGLFQEAGVPADQALRGLTTAFKQLNAAGKDPVQGLKDMVAQIKAMHDAGNDLGDGGSRDLAEQYFGKGFGPILQSIIDGRFEIDKIPASLDNTKNAIHDAKQATEDFSETWQKVSNNFSVVLKPAATSFFNWMNDALIDITVTMTEIPMKFAEAWHNLKNGNILQDVLGFFGLGNGPSSGGGGGSWGDNNGMTPPAPGGSSRTGSNKGLTSNSIGAKSAIESAFPGVKEIGGWRPPDITPNGTFTEHSSGQAIDVMVPNWNTPGGKAYGDQIKQYILSNAAAYGVDYVLWQQTQWNADGSSSPMSDRGSPTQNHMDHVHIHTAKNTAGVGPATPDMAAGQFPTGASQRERRGLPPLGGAPAGAPPASPVGPATMPVSPAIADFPSPDQVGPASATMTPVQMVPSPFGPQYAPVPAGSTPGFNQYGKPGTYLPDPDRVDSATKRYQQSLDNINEANDAIAEAKQRQAEIEADVTADSKKRADAQKAVNEAEKRRNQLIDDAKEAQDALADAKLGTFREAQKAQKEKAKAASGGMDNLADDFGLSEGLPGLVKWFTTFAMNMAMAPMLGQLQAVSQASPIQGGYGALGIFGAQNIANGLTPLGLAPGSAFMPGASAYTPGISAMGPAPLQPAVGPGTGYQPLTPGLVPPSPMGGAAGAGYAGGPPATPATSMPSLPQASSGGGGGFQGIDGLPLEAAMTATAGLDMLAPGSSQAAQMGIKLANRAAGYAGQVAGIGVSGLMETLLPHGSALADPGKSWVGRIAGGIAGARPALPNQAGGQQQNPAGQSQPPQTPEEAQALAAQNGGGQGNGPMVNIENMVNQTPDEGQTLARQMARMTAASYSSGGAPMAMAALV